MSHCHDKRWLTKMGGQWWSGAALLLRKVSSLLITVTLFIFTIFTTSRGSRGYSPGLTLTPGDSSILIPETTWSWLSIVIFTVTHWLTHSDLCITTHHYKTALHVYCEDSIMNITSSRWRITYLLKLNTKKILKSKCKPPCPKFHLSWEFDADEWK